MIGFIGLVVGLAFLAFAAYLIFVAVVMYQGHKRQTKMAQRVRVERGR